MNFKDNGRKRKIKEPKKHLVTSALRNWLNVFTNESAERIQNNKEPSDKKGDY
ncbi:MULTISPECIES: hypothetical protein [Vibrio]|uniref:hypothetical protein n=1 Tax=Vibrio TaxID=662 RepID=UPI00387B4243